MPAFLLIQEGKKWDSSYLQEFVLGFMHIQATAETPHVFDRVFCTCRISYQVKKKGAEWKILSEA